MQREEILNKLSDVRNFFEFDLISNIELKNVKIDDVYSDQEKEYKNLRRKVKRSIAKVLLSIEDLRYCISSNIMTDEERKELVEEAKIVSEERERMLAEMEDNKTEE